MGIDLISDIRLYWSWTGLEPRELVGHNQFGNLIVTDTEARYWRIFPEELSCEVIAEDGNAFSELAETEDFRIDWEMSKLVQAARQAHGPLTDGQVYFCVIPPVFGGAYDASNIIQANLVEVIQLAGSYAEQIKDLPDGRPVELKIVERVP